MLDATNHILGVSDGLTQTWYDIHLCAPTHKRPNTNRQRQRAESVSALARLHVEMHIQCGTVGVEQVGEEKAYVAVIGGTMLRRASWHCGGV